MDIEFNTNEYEWAHAKKPRGRGLWIFTARIDGKPHGEYLPHSGTYLEAKIAIARRLREAYPNAAYAEVRVGS